MWLITWHHHKWPLGLHGNQTGTENWGGVCRRDATHPTHLLQLLADCLQRTLSKQDAPVWKRESKGENATGVSQGIFSHSKEPQQYSTQYLKGKLAHLTATRLHTPVCTALHSHTGSLSIILCFIVLKSSLLSLYALPYNLCSACSPALPILPPFSPTSLSANRRHDSVLQVKTPGLLNWGLNWAQDCCGLVWF